MAAPPPPPLPPGVYFNPTPEECVRDYLKPWVAGGWNAQQAMHGAVFPVDIYKHSPDALRRAWPPGHARAHESRWFFLTPCARNGGRGQRGVATGGHWKVEQKSKGLLVAADGGEVGEGGGKRRTYGFYLGDRKTSWLMEEMAEREGGRDEVVPVLCRVYVSPRASDDEKRAIFGEDGVAVDADGKPKPARVAVHGGYFDLLAQRLPPSCVRVRGQGQDAVAPPPPMQQGLGHHQGAAQFAPPEFVGNPQYVHHAPPAAAAFHGQQHHGQHALPPFGLPGHHQHGQAAPPQHVLAQQQQHQYGPPAVDGPYYVQAAAPEFHGHQHGQNAGVYYLPPPPIVVAVPQQGDEETEEEEHVDKKARLTYASPAPQATGSTTPTCKIEPPEYPEQSIIAKYHHADAAILQEPAAVPPPPQDSPVMTGTASPEFDEGCSKGQAPGDEPLRRGGSSDSSSLTQLSFGEDFGMACQTQLTLDGMPPLEDCDFFLDDIMNNGNDDDDGFDYSSLFAEFGGN